MVAQLVLTAALLLQQSPEITVGIRPQALRVGAQAVLSVRVLASEGLPEWVELVPPAGLEVVDVRDRSSRGVGTGGGARWVLDREIYLRAQEAGEYQLPDVQVVVGGQVFQARSPRLTVSAAPLQWAPPPSDPNRDSRERDRSRGWEPRPQGVPPATGEMGEAAPGGGASYAPWGYPGAYPWSGIGYPVQIPGGGAAPGQLPGGSAGYPGWWPGAAPGGGWWGYPGGWYGYPPTPYGPNGGWPVLPPGGMPGLSQPGGGVGWSGIPGGYAPGTMAPGVLPPSGGPPGSSPYGVPGGASGSPALLPPPGGQWPAGMGGGWAETAAGDPWWPEIVPELFGYATAAQDPGGEVTLSGGLTPGRVFVGQQVTWVASASFRPGAFLSSTAAPEYVPPASADFWGVDLPEPLVAGAVASGGGVEQVYTFRRALFPLRPGEQLVPPAHLLLPRGGGDPRGAAWDTLSTEPLPVSVLPVPRADGLPGYAGAVGRYRLEAGITPTRLAVGETALLVVRILGVGNVATVSAPELGPIYGAEVAPGGDGAVMEVRDGVVGGVRTFTWLVVPTQPGPLRIGPILFGYFDPYLGDFGQAASQELMLEVTEFPVGQQRAPR